MITAQTNPIDLWLDGPNQKLILYRKESGSKIFYFRATPRAGRICNKTKINSMTYFQLLRQFKGGVILQ